MRMHWTAQRTLMQLQGRWPQWWLAGDWPGRPMPVVSLHAQVRRVAQLFPTAIISGRGREKVQQFVQLAELYYAGRWVQLPRLHGTQYAASQSLPLN